MGLRAPIEGWEAIVWDDMDLMAFLADTREDTRLPLVPPAAANDNTVTPERFIGDERRPAAWVPRFRTAD